MANQNKKQVFAFLLLSLSSISLAFADPESRHHHFPPPPPVPSEITGSVTVINAADQPIPTAPQGVTPISGEVTATQAGTWQVQIANPTTSPVPVQVMNASTGTSTPEEIVSTGQCIFGTGAEVSVDVYTVPTGKRLIVDDMSVYASGAGSNISGAAPTEIVFIRCATPSYRRYFSLNSVPSVGSGEAIASGGDSVHITAEAGETITCTHVRRNLGNVTGQTCGWISGHLINVP